MNKRWKLFNVSFWPKPMIQVSKTSPIVTQGKKFHPINYHQQKLKIFWCQFLTETKHLNHRLQKSVKFGAFLQLTPCIFILNVWKSKILRRLGYWIELWIKLCLYILNTGQNIWNKVKKSSKNGQEQKKLMSVFH